MGGMTPDVVKLLLFVLFCGCITGEFNLDDALEEYDTLRLDHFSHRVVKRSLNTHHPDVRQIEFDAVGRHFHLYLQKKKMVSRGFKVYAVNKHDEKQEVDTNTENFYQGIVIGEPQSSVQAYFEDDGSMTATIRSQGEVYSIEPSWRHLPASANYSMIAYKGSKVKQKEDLGGSYCGYVDMNKEADGAAYHTVHNTEEEIEAEERERAKDSDHAGRYKRQANSRIDKNTCPLLLVADYRFFENMGQKSVSMTSNYLLGLIDRVSDIYEKTDFGGGYNGMGFEIKEVWIHNEPHTQADHYNTKKDTWDTKLLLEVFSRNSYARSFCLSHLFTYQAFEGGVLGLAYIGSPRPYSVGGVCSPVYYKGGHSLYLNTGWSSSLNRANRRLLTQEADLVTTHEFGHNWGSEHDPDTVECSPSSFSGGKYIMYTYSVSGYDKNNKFFSPCSKRSVAAVLRAKSGGCFASETKQFCGNFMVEPGEECDVGPDGQSDDDPCCDKYCFLRSTAKCSDANQVCCDSQCQYAPSTKKCYDEVGMDLSCELPTFCSGTSSNCSKVQYKPDNEDCLQKGKCKGGVCQSFCESQGKVSCVCDEPEKSCSWCCKQNQSSKCEPHLFTDSPDSAQALPDGMPCVYGYCNDQGICEKRVQDLVQRWWNIIEDFSPSKLVAFMRANIVGTVIVFSLLIWIPASCIISFIDRKNRKKQESEMLYYRPQAESITFNGDAGVGKTRRLTGMGVGSQIRKAQNTHRRGARSGSRA